MILWFGAAAVGRGAGKAGRFLLGVIRAAAAWTSRQRLTRRALKATAVPAIAGEARFSPAPFPPAEISAPASPDPDEVETEQASRSQAEETASDAEEVREPEGGQGGARPRPRRSRSVPQRWKAPPKELLVADAASADSGALEEFIADQTRAIQQTLQAFRVDGKIVSVTPGSRVILFEWQPAPGVKASKLEHLADDLAIAMKVERVRVVLPLPGKGTIGIEVPHPAPAGVTLGGLLSNQVNLSAAGDLPVYLGRALTGETLAVDLVTLPHLLVAGTTGSGKSVCIHTLLLSLLMARTPDELRLVLIDPKRVELIAYRETPHLLFDVVTDAKQAVTVLRWVVSIMDARYRLLARNGCRDLHVYNRALAEGAAPAPEEEDTRSAVVGRAGLPWILVAIDELADLMVVKAREVEDALQRLAQMARGVGIHLIVATQRPSVDVLTGVIKANLPSRLSFQVATRIDSRTILDGGGAEQLLGKGDMLFAPAGSPGPQRAQGAFVSPAEVKRVLDHWEAQGTAERFADLTQAPEATGEGAGGSEGDDALYEEALEVVMRTGEASVSMLQRRLSIGFSRAGRLVDLLEQRGVVGPKQGSKAREILADRSAYTGPQADER